MSSPSTAAYLRSGELPLSLPATTQVRSQFRFISKESGDAAITAAQIRSPAPFVPTIPGALSAMSLPFSIDLSVCSPLRSRDTPAYTTAVAPATPPVPPHVIASRTARAASFKEAPVVIRSSTSTTGPPASNGAPPATTSSAPARLSSRCRELSPDWSATHRRCRSTATTRAGVPVRRNSPAAASAIRRAGSCPRARTAPRAEGTGTSNTGASPPLRGLAWPARMCCPA